MANNTNTTNQTSKKPREDELGVLWARESRPKSEGGVPMTYFSGTINVKSLGGLDKDIPLIIFKNSFKTADNQPDLRIYLKKPQASVMGTTTFKPKSVAATPAPEGAPEGASTPETVDTSADVLV